MNEQNPYQPSFRVQERDLSVSDISVPPDSSPLLRGAKVGAIVGGFFGLLMFVLLLIVLRPFGVGQGSFFGRLEVGKWLVLVALFFGVPFLFGMVFGAAGFWVLDVVLRRFPLLRNWLQ
jgi:hypothetical protein